MSSGSTVEVALALIWRQVPGGRPCILISRRRQDAHLGGLWEFPGGKCRPGEHPDECAEREALEELGVGCRAERVRPAIEFEYPDRTIRLHPVDCRYLGGAPRPIEVAEWRWARPEDLGEYEFPAANAALIAELTGRTD